jgi:hypothetical protein
MKRTAILSAALIALLGMACGTPEKKEGSRFSRLDENTVEYQAKAEAYMAAYFKTQGIIVDSIKVDGQNLRIKINEELADSVFRVYAGQSAMEYYKFKKRTALIQNPSVHVFCASKRGLVAQAIYP